MKVYVLMEYVEWCGDEIICIRSTVEGAVESLERRARKKSMEVHQEEGRPVATKADRGDTHLFIKEWEVQ